MKTVHCVHLLNDYSGSPRVLKQTMTALQRRSGYRCELYTGSHAHGVLDDLDVAFHTFSYRRFDNRWLTLMTYIWSQCVLFLLMARRVRRGSIVLVNTMLPFGAALAGKLKGARVVYHVHETSLRPRLLKVFLRRIIACCADRIIYVSKYVQQAERIEGVENTVVYNGLAEDFLQAAQASDYQPRRNGIFNVLMLASLKAYKGVDEFLMLAASMADDPSLNFTLVLNATDEEIDEYMAGKPKADNLRLYSAKPTVIDFYQQASLVLNLSHVDGWVETFGLTILEAMAFGIPTIVPPVGGPTELVDEDVEGYRIDSRDREKLLLAVTRLAQQPQLCYALSEKARAKASGFSSAHFQDNIVMVFDDL